MEILKKMSRVQKDCRAIELSMMEDSRDKEKKKKSDASCEAGHLKRVNDAGTASAVPESTESLTESTVSGAVCTVVLRT
jgi:hypothetical protein